jgi:hypothetical protein
MLIHGVLIDEHEAPIPWASVLFTEAPVPLPDVAAMTDDHGGFTLTAPAPGRYRLRCQAPDHEPAELTVDVGGGDVTVTCRLAPA